MIKEKECSITPCERPAKYRITFNWMGVWDYCDNHGWPHARSEGFGAVKEVERLNLSWD